jgi:hypothetical protein
MVACISCECPAPSVRFTEEVRHIGCANEPFFALTSAHALGESGGKFKGLQVIGFNISPIFVKLSVSPENINYSKTIIGWNGNYKPAISRVTLYTLNRDATPVCVEAVS